MSSWPFQGASVRLPERGWLAGWTFASEEAKMGSGWCGIRKPHGWKKYNCQSKALNDKMTACQHFPTLGILLERNCVKHLAWWGRCAGVFLLAFLYRSHLPMTAGPAVDICNITATMITLTPAAFISTALFLCQCETPFELQMEHKQAIIWVQRIQFFPPPLYDRAFMCWGYSISFPWKSRWVFFLHKPSASEPIGLPLQMANVSSHVKHS